MDSSLQFSFILPVRNGGEYFKECVNSILAQNYRNYDLIVLDNASTDGTVDWLRAIKDPRIRLFESSESLSIEENWSRILSVSKNEFMTITGHDDVFDTNYLQAMCELIDNYPEAGLYQSHYRIIDVNGKKIRSCMRMPEKEYSAEFLKSRLLFKRDSFGTGYMFRASDYQKVGGIPPYKKLMFADDALWLMLMRDSFKATARTICFSYREHSQSTSGSPDWRLTYVALTSYLAFLGNLAQTCEKISVELCNHLNQYMVFWYQWAYFNAKDVSEKKEVEAAIGQFVSKVEKKLGELGCKNVINIKREVRKQVYASLGRFHWIFRRLNTWIRRRI